MNEQITNANLIRDAAAVPGAESVIRAEDASLGGRAQVTPTPRRSKKRRFILLALLALTGSAAYYGFRYWSEGRYFITTEDAYVKADVAILSAKISGHLVGVNVVENQSVRKGDLLAQIDPGDYRLAVDAAQRRVDTQTATIARIQAQAQAQKSIINQAEAQENAALAEQRRAAAEFDRAQSLVQKNFATPQRLEQTKADRDKTIANLAGADAGIASAKANLAVLQAQGAEAESLRDELRIALDRAKRDLDFTEFRAPFDGVVGNKAAQPGMFVQPGARLMALVPLQSVYVEANFKETQIGAIQPGQKAILHIDAYADKKIEAIVESVSPASGAQFSLLPPENATGNFTKIVQRVPVRIALPQSVTQTGRLRPGLSVVVEIDTRLNGVPAPQRGF